MIATAVDIAAAVRAGTRRAVEVLEESLATIEERDGELNAFVHLDPALARRGAEAVDAMVRSGEDPGPLAGVPFAVKDLEDCAGMPTQYGSLAFRGRPPATADSLHVARMRRAGAVPVGKTATPEFGTLPFTSTKVWGVTRSPWDRARTPGGSSGGSAAAVSAGMVPIATATDGGGSIRIPASFCGLVGFKPSFGRIPYAEPSASQTLVAGALTTTVRDAARHLDVVAGPDDRDRTSLPAPTVRDEQAIDSVDVRGLKARWSPDLGFAITDPEVAAITRAAAEDLAGAAGLDFDDKPVQIGDPVRTWLLATAIDLWLSIDEGSWPAIAEELSPEARGVLEHTERQSAPRLARALRRRAHLDHEVATLFGEVDVLLTPTTAITAFAAGGPSPDKIAGTKVDPMMILPFTMLASTCWNPACSVPAGVDNHGLPIGVQIMGRRHHDHVVLRLAHLLEQTRPWLRLAPRPACERRT